MDDYQDLLREVTERMLTSRVCAQLSGHKDDENVLTSNSTGSIVFNCEK